MVWVLRVDYSRTVRTAPDRLAPVDGLSDTLSRLLTLEQCPAVRHDITL